ncbi:MAG: ABC transporter substrate-binding protein [Thermomicrobiales bacterium]
MSLESSPRTSARLLSNPVTRRRLVGVTAGAIASAALVSRSHAEDASPAASPVGPRGEWTFTNDKGVTITLPSRPERIVADVNAAAPLWDFGIRPVAVFGWNATDTGDFGPAGGNVDPSTVAVVGDSTEPIKPEAVAAQHPDLIVTLTWAPGEPTEYWSIAEDILPQVQPIAPVIAISATGMADANTERFAELAAALGADLDSPELVEARTTYTDALASFKEVATEKRDLTAVFISIAASETAYVAYAHDWADLSLYEHLGLTIVGPTLEKGAYWEEISLEQAMKYPADILFNSTRPGNLNREELEAHPTFGQQPAVKAGQIGEWNQDFIMSYQGMTDALNTTIAPIQTAKKIIN